MKNILPTLLLASGFIFNIAVADDGRSHWYVGVGTGPVFSDYNISDFDDGSIISGNVDDDGSGWKAFAGYDFTRHFSFEGGYIDFDALDLDSTNTFEGISDGTGTTFVSFPSAPVSVDIDGPSGFFVNAIGAYPLAERLTITVKAGALFWQADETINDLNPRTIAVDGTSEFFGIGLEYRFSNGIGLRAEKELYRDIARLDREFTTIGIVYRFK